REEELRRRQCHRLAGADELRLHTACQPAGAQSREGNPVAMVWIHVGLNLEDESAHAQLGGVHGALVRFLCARGRGIAAQRIQQIADAEIFKRGAEEYRREVAFAERTEIETLA